MSEPRQTYWTVIPQGGERVYEFHQLEYPNALQGFVRQNPETNRWQVIRPDRDEHETADQARAALFGVPSFDDWEGSTPPDGWQLPIPERVIAAIAKAYRSHQYACEHPMGHDSNIEHEGARRALGALAESLGVEEEMWAYSPKEKEDK